MLIQEPLINSQVITLAKDYGDQLISTLNNLKSNLQKDSISVFCNGNPECIDSGISGNLLYLLELYKALNDTVYLDVVDEWIEILLNYIDENPTNDYSLYTGRGGFVYLLIQRNSITQDKKLLDECLRIIVPVNQWYLNSEFTTDYFYDGRAGTMLVLIDLYQITREKFLLDYIDAFLNKIIANAKITRNGIFWDAAYEYNLKSSCSFAYGAAGIKYVFKQLNNFCNNEGLAFVINGIDQYSNSCWIENNNNWGDYSREILNAVSLNECKHLHLTGDADLLTPRDKWSWAYGTIGNLGILESAVQNDIILADILNRKISDFNAEPISLFDGLAGLGLFIHNLPDTSDTINEKLEEIKKTVLSKSIEIETSQGLLHGALGGMYFILKSLRPSDQSQDVLNYSLTRFSKEFKFNISLDLLDLFKQCLVKLYPRTISLSNIISPNALSIFLKKSSISDSTDLLSKMPGFITSYLKSTVSPAIYERVFDVFLLETQKVDMLNNEKRSSLQIYLDSLLFQDRILTVLNKPDDWLLMQTVCIADSVKFIRSRWMWSSDRTFSALDKELVKAKEFSNLKDPEGEFNYFFQIFETREVDEASLAPGFDIIMKSFLKPKPLKQVILDVKSYIKNLPEEKWKRLAPPQLNHKKISSINDFLDDVDWIVLKQVKPLIYRDILKIC
ncbi:lanthionine synthetase LanC family protein [Pedobacter sp. FW305-3-2-15-E-R2A2]|uniref:lanthionine synthetase LanC family protein n=1 Tax=Pedobacter sp. FW305-3-2-15-E-R2A2 TaxID=3140251 RepID=UPI00314080A2